MTLLGMVEKKVTVAVRKSIGGVLWKSPQWNSWQTEPGHVRRGVGVGGGESQKSKPKAAERQQGSPAQSLGWRI